MPQTVTTHSQCSHVRGSPCTQQFPMQSFGTSPPPPACATLASSWPLALASFSCP